MNSQSRSVFIRFYPWLVLGGPVPRGHDDLFGGIADFKPRWRRFAARSRLSGFRRLG